MRFHLAGALAASSGASLQYTSLAGNVYMLRAACCFVFLGAVWHRTLPCMLPARFFMRAGHLS